MFEEVQQVIDHFRRGGMLLVVDHEERESEGDLCLAAVHTKCSKLGRRLETYGAARAGSTDVDNRNRTIHPPGHAARAMALASIDALPVYDPFGERFPG